MVHLPMPPFSAMAVPAAMAVAVPMAVPITAGVAMVVGKASVKWWLIEHRNSRWWPVSVATSHQEEETKQKGNP